MSKQYPFAYASEEVKRAVWAKGTPINPDSKGNSYDPSVWRWDKCGQVMHYPDHGNRNSDVGWEIDHIRPTSKGGNDELSNLQPLNWKMNAEKGDTYPWECPRS